METKVTYLVKRKDTGKFYTGLSSYGTYKFDTKNNKKAFELDSEGVNNFMAEMEERYGVSLQKYRQTIILEEC